MTICNSLLLCYYEILTYKGKFSLSKLAIQIIEKLRNWLMEPGGSMSHSHGLSNNSHPLRSNLICSFFFATVVPNYQPSSEVQCEVLVLRQTTTRFNHPDYIR